MLHGAPSIAHTGTGKRISTRNGFTVFVNLVDLVIVKNTGDMGVTLSQNHVSIGLDHVERALFNEFNHAFIKGELHGHELVHLFRGKVLVNGVFKGRRELMLVAFGGVDSVAFSKLPNEHGGQVILSACKKHVPCGRNTRLEVVGDRWVLAGAQGLETIVPPRDKGRFL